mmetsp:Transcript_4197/g.13810  ORF Transcript_4197/g.13810 Transcript_4197/m.13810 type:complete len:229 (-) Transcript_4197:1396-2082(-)
MQWSSSAAPLVAQVTVVFEPSRVPAHVAGERGSAASRWLRNGPACPVGSPSGSIGAIGLGASLLCLGWGADPGSTPTKGGHGREFLMEGIQVRRGRMSQVGSSKDRRRCALQFGNDRHRRSWRLILELYTLLCWPRGFSGSGKSHQAGLRIAPPAGMGCLTHHSQLSSSFRAHTLSRWPRGKTNLHFGELESASHRIVPAEHRLVRPSHRWSRPPRRAGARMNSPFRG